jgi:hypothetical protein
MNCPICGALARNISPAGFDGLVVACRNCGSYEISDAALNGLIRLDFEDRKAALEKAKGAASPAARPAIHYWRSS